MRTLAKSISVLLAGGLFAACSRTEGPSGPPIGVLRVLLQRASDCASLESMLREDARKKMNAQIDALVESVSRYGGDGWRVPPVFGLPTGAAANIGESADTASSRATDFSETNTQVDSVDEADIVKNDGKYIYLLHGDHFLILDAWPASALRAASSLAIEGQPSEMYVAGNSVVVFSVVDGRPIYEAAGVAPRASYFDGVRYGTAANVGGSFAPFPGYFYTPLTKLTVLALNGAEAAVTRELYLEGSYVSSRRVSEHVRTVIAGGGHGPALNYSPPEPWPTTPEGWKAAYEALRGENEAKIQAAGYADWVPLTFTRTASGVTASHGACEDFYVPTAGSTEYGMTSLVTLNLKSADAPKAATIMGAIDTVYSTANTMYLAARSWGDPGLAVVGWASAGGGAGGAASVDGGRPVADAGTVEPGRDAGAPALPPPSGPRSPSLPAPAKLGQVRQAQEALVTLNRTHLHKFAFTTPDEPVYVASGTVPGSIDDQFSIDEFQGFLRVATTEERTTATPGDWQQTRANNLFVLAPAGDSLEIRGSLTDLEPGEQIYSSRFLGKMAYLVTFRRVDPLFAIDLSNPAKPAVLGSLEIPGFSEYMHPIDDGHLFTIGRDQGVSVQLFDVTDPTAPKLADKFVFSGGGYTEAAQSHKAFTFFASRGMVAFPYVGYSTEGSGMRSSLELFHVDVSKGIEHTGSIDHSAFFTEAPHGYCGGYYGAEIRRGLFMEDFVYAISYGGVTAHAGSDLVSPVASLPLPAPDTGFAQCMPL